MSLQTLLARVEEFLGLIPSDVPAAASVVVQLPAGVHTEMAAAVAAIKADAAPPVTPPVLSVVPKDDEAPLA